MSNKAKAVIFGTFAGISVALLIPVAAFLSIYFSAVPVILDYGVYVVMAAVAFGVIAGVMTGRSLARRVARRPEAMRSFPTPWLTGEARA